MTILVLVCVLSAIVITVNINRDISYLNTKKNDALTFRNKWLTFTGVNKSLLITDISEPAYQDLLRKHKIHLTEITETIRNINTDDYLKEIDNELLEAYKSTFFIWDLSRDDFDKTRILLESTLEKIIGNVNGYGSIIEIKERLKTKGNTKAYLKLNELLNRTLSLSSANDSFNNALANLILIIDKKTTEQKSFSQKTLLFVSILLVLVVMISLILFGNQIIKNIKIVIKLNKEIGERRKIEDTLRKSEKYNRMLFEESATGLILCKTNGDIVDINSTYASIIGRTVEETKNLSYWDITPKKYNKQEQQQLDLLEKTGRYGPYEKEYIRADGQLVPVRLSGLILNQYGEKFIWSSVEDITKYKQAENEKEILQLELQQSQKNEALGKLTGGIAHEYNNMLGIVIGFAELLHDELKENPKLLKYTDEIQNAGYRGTKLTSKLLSYSRRKVSEADSVNLNTLLQKQSHMLEKTLTVRIDLIFKLKNNLWNVWLNPSDMEDVILNLCINAMHAMKDTGHLTIETNNQKINPDKAQTLGITPGDYVSLSFTDTGCGIKEEIINKIFDPFFSTKGEFGTGLGLSLVYGFIQENNGDIKIHSKVGEGTRFDLYFPRYKGSSKTPLIVEKNESEVQHTTNVTILAVDDELSLLKLTTKILESRGYKVLVANSAKKALSILENESVEIMISDIIMPEMDGYQLAAIVKEKYPDIKIQLVSGYSDDKNMALIDDELHQNILQKPVNALALLKRVHELATQ